MKSNRSRLHHQLLIVEAQRPESISSPRIPAKARHDSDSDVSPPRKCKLHN
ncbi:hypothetical protein COOONC_26182, partial [Cooperia oncophora]